MRAGGSFVENAGIIPPRPGAGLNAHSTRVQLRTARRV